MLHTTTLEHKQVESQKQHLKVLWGPGGQGTEDRESAKWAQDQGLRKNNTQFL